MSPLQCNIGTTAQAITNAHLLNYIPETNSRLALGIRSAERRRESNKKYHIK